YVNPYDTDAHRLWVEQGNCPAIHRTKTWCGDRAGHRGDHHAPRLTPPGVVQDYLWWSDAENHDA
ncbi:MAG TPA: hypothetical protein VFJ21_02545, partial [Mycobacteriales bacterium]|nr:hypothetical protein [Mycobacteriales bacterium]